MPKALVVSQRGSLLEGLLAATAGSDLEFESRADLLSALAELRRIRPALVVLDVATLAPTDVAMLRSVRLQHPRVTLLAVVPAKQPDLIREALRAGANGLLLDPFDLGETEAVVKRLLSEQGAAAKEPEALDALAVFLKGLSHEILNPLTSISGILQILLHEGGPTPNPANSERVARYRAMLQGVERIQKTLRELEYFVRARKPQRRLLDPAHLVREVTERLRHGDPPLQVTCDTPDLAPAILADQEQLTIAIRHLAHFAAGPQRTGGVELLVRPLADRIELQVLGTVAVVLPDRPEQLLVPYQDLNGTGRAGNLELSAAYGILRSHRGTLEVEGGPEGAVRFRATLPLPQHSGPDEESRPASV